MSGSVDRGSDRGLLSSSCAWASSLAAATRVC